MDWRFILSLLFAVIVAIFAIQNASPVDIKFLSMHLSISQALVILISAVFGAVTVFLLSVVRFFKLKVKLKESNKALALLETENENLKQTVGEKKEELLV